MTSLIGPRALAQSPEVSLEGLRVVVADAAGKSTAGRGDLTRTLRKLIEEEVGPLIPYQSYLSAEQALGVSSVQKRTPESTAKAGRMVGAQYVLIVNITRDGWLYTARALLINCETAEVQMDFRAGYYKPAEEASDRGRRIALTTIQKLKVLLTEKGAQARVEPPVKVTPDQPPPPPPPEIKEVPAEGGIEGKVETSTGTVPPEEGLASLPDSAEPFDPGFASEGEDDTSIIEDASAGVLLHGHFQTYTAIGVRGRFEKDLVIFTNRLQLDLESRVGDIQVVAQPQLEFDWLTKDFKLAFRELFAARYWGYFDLQFGLRIITWGITDFYPVVDIVNARDFRTFRRWRPLDEKVPIPMAQARLVLDPVTIDALLIPWTPETKWQLDQEMPFAAPVVVPVVALFEEQTVPFDLSGVGGGGKIDLQLADWKLSAFSLVGRNPLLSIYVDVVRGGPGGPRVNTINEKVLMAALAVQGGLGFIDSIIKIEGAYYHQLDDICARRIRETEDVPPFTDAPRCFFLRRVPQFRGTVGLERKLFTGLDAHVQFIAEFLHKDEIEEVPELVVQALPGFQQQNVFNPIFTLRLEGRWVGDDFRPALFGYVSLAEEDFFVNLDLEYVIADGLAIAIGGFFFYGYSDEPNKNRYTLFGAIEDSTNVYGKVTAWF